MKAILNTMALLALATSTLAVQASDGSEGGVRVNESKTFTVADPLLVPFLKPIAYTQMSLSPDGRHAAAIAINPARDNSAVLMIDTDTLDVKMIVQPRAWKVNGYEPYVRRPRSVRWLDDARIAVNFTVADGAIFDLDGTAGNDLMEGYLHPLRDAAGKPTDWHIVIRERAHMTFSAVNVHTKESRNYDLDLPDDLEDWATDRTGDIRAARTRDTSSWSDHTTLTTWYRADTRSKWQKVDERAITADPFHVISVADRPGHLIVEAYNGGDRLAIWDYDVAGHAYGELMAGHPTEDVVAQSFEGAADVGGEVKDVITDGLRTRHYWFDEHYARLQAVLDASLPDHVNVLLSAGADHVLVYSYSDVDPGRWYAMDAKALKMKEIAQRMPSIDPARMQPVQALRYPSFDGTSVPAYLTLPGKPAKPAPLVVLIHGGPQARDHWEFDSEVQILAAHGYAVFQPQFRGSTGFGRRFEEAGYGQWGRAMQDDITAGVHWLIDRKIADPQRICIVGASYGGYAALWGLEKTPDLYKCGVSLAGVTDLGRMLVDQSDTSYSSIGREMIRHRMGDAFTQAAALDEVSPVKHADRIVVPVLIAHGEQDGRVPISHGKRMRDALQDLHKDVQWLYFPHAGHGLRLAEEQAEYYDALFALLA
ncbi:MAG: alpha/beta fold hydrolase, partial [Betaproteobacteria bacterium]